MATPNEHRTKAEELLALARTYPHNSAARLATLTEAQVHAVLALPAADDHGTLASPEVDAALIASTIAQDAPKAARRTRKAAPAKEEA